MKKVELPGHGVFWFLEEDGVGPLAPLDHCDGDGNLLQIWPMRLSYAHVFADGEIKRFNQVIGRIEDLKECEPSTR